jgi:hypothetical protein
MTRFGVFFVGLVMLMALVAYNQGRERGAALSADAQNGEGKVHNQFMSDARPNFTSARIVRKCKTDKSPDVPQSVSFTFDAPCPPGARIMGTWRVVYRPDNSFDHLELVTAGE